MSLVVVLLISQKAIAKDVTLSWDPSPTPTVTGYQVLVSLNQGLSPLLLSLDAGNVLTLKILGLENTDEHWFCVKAYDANRNQSVCSNVVKSPATALPVLDLNINVEVLK